MTNDPRLQRSVAGNIAYLIGFLFIPFAMPWIIFLAIFMQINRWQLTRRQFMAIYNWIIIPLALLTALAVWKWLHR